MNGKLFVVSAPSGSGKTTLCNKLLKSNIGLADSVSMTTRRPRPGEKNGRDYFFVTRRKFFDTARRGGFLEHEENFGNLYGTPKEFIDKELAEGRSVLLSIDVKGAMKVRRVYPKESVLIFIMPPSLASLKKRLVKRGSDDTATMKRRLKIAKREIGYKKRYDYTVINDRLDVAYKRLKKIVLQELREAE